MKIKSDKTIDCVGLFCPMPIARTKQAIQDMKPGQVLEIIADDPGFEKDFPEWCKISGEEFIEITREGGLIKGYVKKT